jgi:hypothetical protein
MSARFWNEYSFHNDAWKDAGKEMRVSRPNYADSYVLNQFILSLGLAGVLTTISINGVKEVAIVWRAPPRPGWRWLVICLNGHSVSFHIMNIRYFMRCWNEARKAMAGWPSTSLSLYNLTEPDDTMYGEYLVMTEIFIIVFKHPVAFL